MTSIDCTPTWVEILPTWLLLATQAMEPGGNREAKRQTLANFTREMTRMAESADRWNAHCRAQKEVES